MLWRDKWKSVWRVAGDQYVIEESGITQMQLWFVDNLDFPPIVSTSHFHFQCNKCSILLWCTSGAI